MKKTNKANVLKLAVSAACLALCMVLPFITGQIQQIGNMLCPMHIPVLLCGLLCGPAYAGLVGAIAPLLRFMLFGMPKLYPSAAGMCFELAAYGIAAGMILRALPKKRSSVYAALIGAMLIGRAVWGVAMAALMGLGGGAFTMSAFLAGAFANAVPGIIVHILLIPVIVMAVQKAVPELR
ncbi:MAG: ECF transporter S component [Clostridia bacterium]|nr:ECF transporter S component [Clostridia bacterium]